MKVTAILPDKLISEVKDLSNGKNITESLKIALGEWIALQRIKKLNRAIKRKSLNFSMNSSKIREINRRS
ncbi:MAG TPA: DUF2191 domain-containing protein [Ignavibacteria bacterium]|nr:DUF2191 domain-containing protein [Ignavibacteria bacterium]